MRTQQKTGHQHVLMSGSISEFNCPSLSGLRRSFSPSGEVDDHQPSRCASLAIGSGDEQFGVIAAEGQVADDRTGAGEAGSPVAIGADDFDSRHAAVSDVEPAFTLSLIHI